MMEMLSAEIYDEFIWFYENCSSCNHFHKEENCVYFKGKYDQPCKYFPPSMILDKEDKVING